MRENSDAELLAAARDGNKDAFGYLVERYQHMTERIAQRMVGNAYIAQELAQEAVLQAYLSLDPLLRSEGVIDLLALAEEHEVAQVILRSVYALSPAEREATLLFYYAQFRLSEIAVILGISVVAVKGRLHKARKQLKDDLSAWFEVTSVPQVWARRRKTMIQ